MTLYLDADDAGETRQPFWTTNPITRWRRAAYWTAFAILIALAAACVGGIIVSDRGLRTTCTTKSAALEWVASPRAAEHIVTDWRQAGVIGIVQRGVWIDYAFLVLYSTLLAIVVFRCAHLVPTLEWWGPVGDQLGWWMWGAGLLDALENAGILTELSGRGYALAPVIAFVARLKWAVVFLGLSYIAFSVVLWLRYHVSGTDPDLRAEFATLRTPPGGTPEEPFTAGMSSGWVDEAVTRATAAVQVKRENVTLEQ